jgi:hypothetical protein
MYEVIPRIEIDIIRVITIETVEKGEHRNFERFKTCTISNVSCITMNENTWYDGANISGLNSL